MPNENPVLTTANLFTGTSRSKEKRKHHASVIDYDQEMT
jgi:hypothetical protein